MKKVFFIFLFLGSVPSFFAQNVSKEDLKVKLAQETCKCSENKEFNKDNYELSLGLCILEAINNNRSDVENHYGKDYYSHIESISGEVGEKLAVVCPNLLMKIAEFSGDYDDSEELESYEDEELEATFVNSTVDGFLFVNVKENSGKSHQFLLINSFDNSYLITDKVLKAKDKVKIFYFEALLYNAKTSKYENFKVINDLYKL